MNNIVTVKTKGQITLPVNLREQVGLAIGDLLEAKIEKGKITLTPKSIIDKGIEEGLADIKAGRTYGPFNSSEEMAKFLDSRAKKTKRKK